MSKDVFILGAGFSKAVSFHMPSLADLSKAIGPQVGNHFTAFGKPPKELFSNIEAFLSYLSEDHPWLTSSQRLRNRAAFLELSNVIADQIVLKQNEAIKQEFPIWLPSLIKSWHQERMDVITFNYDLLVEIEATKLNFEDGIIPYKLSQHDLYPVPIACGASRETGVKGGGSRRKTFNLYKMHGSLNWYYSGAEEYYGETIYANPITNGIWDNTSNIDQGLKNDLVTLVIPPTMHKSLFFNNETIRGIWKAAGRALREAERVFCLGYSFPLTDLMIRSFILTNQPVGKVEFYWINISKPHDGLKEILPESYSIIFEYQGNDAIQKFVNNYEGKKGSSIKVPVKTNLSSPKD